MRSTNSKLQPFIQFPMDKIKPRPFSCSSSRRQKILFSEMFWFYFIGKHIKWWLRKRFLQCWRFSQY